MSTKTKTIIGVAIGVFVLISIVWFARPAPSGNQQAGLSFGKTSALVAEESAFDFGAISMAAGNVSHKFTIKNSGSNSIAITKLYTSCMCTTAELKIGSRVKGPFGMPGHGFVPGINETIAPNEKASVDVVFDPAAHGPAAVGRIERVVYLENSSGQPLELKISASVAP